MLWELLARKGMHPAGRMYRALQSMHEGTLYQVPSRAECGTRIRQEKCYEKGARRLWFYSTRSTQVTSAYNDGGKKTSDSGQPGRPSKQRSEQGKKGGRTFCSQKTPLSWALEKKLRTGGGADATVAVMKLWDEQEKLAKREWLEPGVDDETKFLGI